jgi:hypothetical protein
VSVTPNAAPPAVPPQQPHKGSGLAIGAFVVATIALLLCLVPVLNNGAFFLALIGFGLGIPAYLGARKGKRTGKGLALAAVIIALVSVVGVLGSQAFYGKVIDDTAKQIDKGFAKVDEDMDTATGANTDKVLADLVTVKTGKFSYTKDAYGLEETALPVTVTNKSSKTMSFDITIEALDSTGTRIADDTLYVNALAPGKSATEKIFTLTNDGAKLAKATFKVSKAGATEQ